MLVLLKYNPIFLIFIQIKRRRRDPRPGVNIGSSTEPTAVTSLENVQTETNVEVKETDEKVDILVS